MLQEVKDVKLSPPWITYCHKIEALFKGDEDIEIKYDDEDMTLKLFVEDSAKADALMKLLPMSKSFGNVTLYINIIPADGENNKVELFREAFKGNPNVVDIATIEDVFSNPISYVIFKKEVIQFFNDDTSDYYGLESTLNENIAREVFGDQDGVYFCTDSNVEDSPFN